jgi:hypothetical protein
MENGKLSTYPPINCLPTTFFSTDDQYTMILLLCQILQMTNRQYQGSNITFRGDRNYTYSVLYIKILHYLYSMHYYYLFPLPSLYTITCIMLYFDYYISTYASFATAHFSQCIPLTDTLLYPVIFLPRTYDTNSLVWALCLGSGAPSLL